MSIEIRSVHDPAGLATTRRLFREYADSLPFDLDFQDFEAELATLPGEYAAPAGCILLASDGDLTLGCVAVRPLDEGVCEMKRLYVRPQHRGKKVGRLLAERIIAEAQRMGYRVMRLDTVSSMAEANALYAHLGFSPIDAYRYNPLEDAAYFELDLT